MEQNLLAFDKSYFLVPDQLAQSRLWNQMVLVQMLVLSFPSFRSHWDCEHEMTLTQTKALTQCLIRGE